MRRGRSYSSGVPEGDTIHRVADRLRPALEGALLRRFDAPRAPRPHPRAGERITEVGAQGKHLLVHFERGLVLDTHMGMTGRWDLYPAGQRWRQPAHLARVVIDVDGWTAVCFSAPTVWVSTRPRVDHLGPDLCDESPDIDECLRRLRALDPATELADALLDQQVCAGVGNVYKSEVCFACLVHPLTPVGAIDDDHARALDHDGGTPTPREPRRRPAKHGRRHSRCARRLRPGAPTVPTLWDADPLETNRAPQTNHVLVCTVSAVAGCAGWLTDRMS